MVARRNNACQRSRGRAPDASPAPLSAIQLPSSDKALPIAKRAQQNRHETPPMLMRSAAAPAATIPRPVPVLTRERETGLSLSSTCRLIASLKGVQENPALNIARRIPRERTVRSDAIATRPIPAVAAARPNTMGSRGPARAVRNCEISKPTKKPKKPRLEMKPAA